MIRNLLFVAVGGALGSCARYLLCRLAASVWPAPAGTLAVNLLGCLIIGLLLGAVERAQLLSPAMVLLLVSGFCGGLTTFSTFSADAGALMSSGRTIWAVAYVAVSVCGGIALTFAGRALVR